jgi:hypothetical protein
MHTSITITLLCSAAGGYPRLSALLHLTRDGTLLLVPLPLLHLILIQPRFLESCQHDPLQLHHHAWGRPQAEPGYPLRLPRRLLHSKCQPVRCFVRSLQLYFHEII